MNQNELPLALSVIEAAKRVGVSRSFLYAEISQGRLRVRKAHKRTLVGLDDLSAWFSALPTRPLPRAPKVSL